MELYVSTGLEPGWLRRWTDRGLRAFDRRVTRTLQGCVNEIDQALLPQRLVEKSNGARLKRHCLGFFVGERRDEYNGRAIAFSDQVLLQFCTAEARHVRVGDQAGSIGYLFGLREVIR